MNTSCITRKGWCILQPLNTLYLSSVACYCVEPHSFMYHDISYHEYHILPVEVRRYMFVWRRLAWNARCNTMSRLTADAVFSQVSREMPDVKPCHTSPPQVLASLIVDYDVDVQSQFDRFDFDMARFFGFDTALIFGPQNPCWTELLVTWTFQFRSLR